MPLKSYEKSSERSGSVKHIPCATSKPFRRHIWASDRVQGIHLELLTSGFELDVMTFLKAGSLVIGLLALVLQMWLWKVNGLRYHDFFYGATEIESPFKTAGIKLHGCIVENLWIHV